MSFFSLGILIVGKASQSSEWCDRLKKWLQRDTVAQPENAMFHKVESAMAQLMEGVAAA